MNLQQTPVPAASAEAPPAAPAAAAQPRSLLVEWANQQDAWIRALTDEVVSTRAEISDERSAHFYDMLLREKGLKGGEPVEVPMLAVGPEALAAGDAFALKSLRAVENVNALAADQTLAFHPKLTILFGENASGKSGYVRILKRAAGVRTQEPILPNVTDETAAAGDPKARFTYTLGGAEAHLDWSDELGIYPLSRIDVFESRSTRLHVDDDLTYVYTPGELSLFPLVQKSIEKVRTRLESDIGNVRQENPYSAAFERGTAVYQKVESLGPATDLNELAALANVTDAERAELAALIAEIDALRSSTPDAQLKAAEVDRKLLEDADTALATLSAFNTEQYLGTLQVHSDASTKHNDVTRRAFEGLNIPGILSDEWKRLVSAGESYIRTHERHETYPREGESCIYCRQDLGPAAVALLHKYRDYCNSQTQAQLVQAQRDLDQLVNRFQIPGLERLTTILAEQVSSASKGGFQSVFEPVLPVLAKASVVLTDVSNRKPVAWENMAAEVSKAAGIINGELSRKLELIDSLKKRLDERQGELKKRESRATELRARVKLAEVYPQVERYVRRLKWTSNAGIVAGKFQGIFRSLTDTSKLASERTPEPGFRQAIRGGIQEAESAKCEAGLSRTPGGRLQA